MGSEGKNAADILEEFRLIDNIYLLGTFERNLTIYHQQVRALNFVWSLLKSYKEPLTEVAVIGGGFAGLTAAAGLLRKGVQHVSIFEKRATLLPLQQGSDARWVHPHIYEWPDLGSELPSAALPLLNWNAGRASDVVVQVMNEWNALGYEANSADANAKVNVFTNVKHLRLNSDLELEWTGERSQLDVSATPSGSKRKFQCIILAVGFGLELNTPFSYWRNETLGQPELGLGKRTYLVSGHGDGALIDLFRIRISQFRQDRILAELFGRKSALREDLQTLKQRLDDTADPSVIPENLYDSFESLAKAREEDFSDLLKSLKARLRADTNVILRMNKGVDRFDSVFNSRASFQNRFLLFLLYRAGGFIPTVHRRIAKIRDEYGIEKSSVIRRHGPIPENAVSEVIDKTLEEKSRTRMEFLARNSKQPSFICWHGGFWNEDDPTKDTSTKKTWRKEHLPTATRVILTGFVAGVAGYLESANAGDDFRVTLHRIIHLGDDTLLQQSCDYIGTTTRLGDKARKGDAGRVFEMGDGTIGYAARVGRILRTRQLLSGETEEQFRAKLKRDTASLKVEKHSQLMGEGVTSVLALPILASDRKTVVAVLFADSTKSDVFTNSCVDAVRKMCQNFGDEIEAFESERVHNFSSSPPLKSNDKDDQLDGLEAIEVLDFDLPFLATTKYLNIEFTDFISAG